MRRSHLAAALLAAGLAAACLPGRSAGQEFLGKKAEAWAADLDPARSVLQRRGAAFALGKIGEPAWEHRAKLYARLLDDKEDPGVCEAAAFALGEISLA